MQWNADIIPGADYHPPAIRTLSINLLVPPQPLHHHSYNTDDFLAAAIDGTYLRNLIS